MLIPPCISYHWMLYLMFPVGDRIPRSEPQDSSRVPRDSEPRMTAMTSPGTNLTDRSTRNFIRISVIKYIRTRFRKRPYFNTYHYYSSLQFWMSFPLDGTYGAKNKPCLRITGREVSLHKSHLVEHDATQWKVWRIAWLGNLPVNWLQIHSYWKSKMCTIIVPFHLVKCCTHQKCFSQKL
jgi:hypothetical protein